MNDVQMITRTPQRSAYIPQPVECSVCGAGHLGDVICKSCYDKFKADLKAKIKEQHVFNPGRKWKKYNEALDWILSKMEEPCR
jgi:hypothetical protein